MLAQILIFMDVLGIGYLILFTAGLLKSPKRVIAKDSEHEISVILPIYKEKTELVKTCLASLSKQNPRRINLYVIFTGRNLQQERLIRSYWKSYKSIRVLHRETPSLVRSCILGLNAAKTEFVCILNADIILRNNSISTLLGFAQQTGADICFGLILPKYTTNFSRFCSIKKLVRQFILQKGRGALGFGYYLPGAFYLAKRRQLIANIREGMVDDSKLMLRAYERKMLKLDCIPVPLAYELEKGTFTAWSLQISRWFLGHLQMSPQWLLFFKNAEPKVKFGGFGLIYIWYVFPIALALSTALALLNGFNPYLLLSFYITITLILYTVKEIRQYHPVFVILFWPVHILVKVVGMSLTLYTFYVMQFNRQKSYVCYKR